MKIFLKNTNTNKIIEIETSSYGDLAKDFRESPYVQLSESEILAYELQEAKTAKLAQLESLRKAFQYANLEVNGHIYVNTETAQNKFFNKLANTTFPMDWRLANLSWVILDQQEALEVRDVIVARETLAYQTESDYFTEINDCTTLEELNTININFN